jgi:diguanylate cyclase (GGDEF)-like protein/PAS domain S-box-containing protein
MSPAARKSPLQWLANATSKVRQAERARAKTKIEMLDSFENAGLGYFWSTDSHGNLDYLSREAIEAGEWKEEQVLGSPISQLFLHDNQAENAGGRSLSFLLAARNAISGHIVRIESGFGDQWWELAGQPCFDDQGNYQGYRGSARDITSERQAKLRQDRRARSCSITGLANRSHILERLTEMLRVFRNTKQTCAILMIDLDRFKQVNELLGQGAGNELLRQAAGRISRIAGEKGSVARLGGDEYLVVLPDQDDRGVLGDYGQRLCQMLSQPYSIDGKQAEVGASVGIAVAPYDGVESSELLDAAEMALYAAKGTRKGTYRFYSNDLKLRAKERAGLEADLRGAEERGELKMFYQPIVDAGTYSLKCVEALIRWEHPRRGWVSPGEFIPIAEESGLIRKIGAWAIRQVCQDAKSWPVEIRAAINVSAAQLEPDVFVETVKNALSSTGVDPSQIELEITESVFVGDFEGTMAIFNSLKKLGVRLSLDDFGTGYSSLGYLRNAPFDKIKIDQCFVRGSTEPGNNNAAIISTVVSLAHALEMDTVAEGIESQDELELVSEKGASHLQGLIFSGAVTGEDLLARLQSGQLNYEPRGPEKYRADRRTEFRRIGLIHDDHRYSVLLRNLSKTGAMVDGLLNVPLGTDVVLDLGGGQLAVATVRRSEGYSQGLEFETALISDGSDGLCTRHRVSPYQIEAAGRPLAALPEDAYSAMGGNKIKSAKVKAFLEADIAYREVAA